MLGVGVPGVAAREYAIDGVGVAPLMSSLHLTPGVPGVRPGVYKEAGAGAAYMSPDGENDIDGVGVPAPVQGRPLVPGRSAMDGVGEKASVSVGERGSKKMCRFGVSGVAPMSFPNDTS